MRYFPLLTIVMLSVFACNQKDKKQEPVLQDTVNIGPAPSRDSVSRDDTTGNNIKTGETRTMKMTFDHYEEGDYAHTIFKETSTGREWDFGHPAENKLNGIAIVLEDAKSGWGYKTNPKMKGKPFQVTISYQKLSGNDLDGKPMEYVDWRITELVEDK